MSDLAKDFIQQTLCVNPKQRPDASQALNHPWLSSAIESPRNLFHSAEKYVKSREKLSNAVKVVSAVKRIQRLHRLISSKSGRHILPIEVTPISYALCLTPIFGIVLTFCSLLIYAENFSFTGTVDILVQVLLPLPIYIK